MSHRPQPFLATSCFHIIGEPPPGAAALATPADYRALQEPLGRLLRRHSIRLVSYCLMPNRWHLVAGPTGPIHLRLFLDWVKSAHPHGYTTVSAIPLRDIDALIRTARAVERQALTVGLVRRAQDWPWGSLVGRRDGTSPLVLVPAPFLESRAWTDYVNAPDEGGEVSDHVAQSPRRFSGALQGREDVRRV